ncbi:hypothetical protein A2U01_0116856, partial [Trifolium medium]|nr:hypothetical protein [Trifolium medium]
KVNPVNSVLSQAQNTQAGRSHKKIPGDMAAFCARLSPRKLGAVGSRSRRSRKC